ncbi:class Ib ribonucleoside-diphosphate reductase assembly flavoprotein NrdI [Lacticaseibacillus hulanensis]|uniref:class Ib ribonucleoside-diphosphate reductase assembly flavoprotein NrdI n=1 Tax=Lacticaseibacillus hulanensis TaxID=2493111 RepID=UPI000FD97720|nr:class Ib ribonucleoside-diphosphate reductase assembly flavoprotein NrdI [Lacticaseibacillus hulanensis]
MDNALRIVYISISGNTEAFVERVAEYAAQKHAKDASQPLVEAYEYTEQFDEQILDQPYFVFVPTYLDGGDGIHTGYHEILTVDLRDELDAGNTDNMLGIVGSGNRNFNAQFGLTAKHYARRFNTPLIGLYELRGNAEEAATIYARMVKYANNFHATGQKLVLA